MPAAFRRLIALLLSFFTCVAALFGGTAVRPWRTEDVAPARDISGDGALAGSVLLASKLANGVQCVYANANRTAYSMTNREMALTHTLGRYGNSATLTTAAGAVYIGDSFDAWCRDADGALWYASHSGETGRVNTIRLGEYYYDVHVRDYDLKPDTFRVDKEFHVWSDRLYLQYTLFADEATAALDSFGAEIRIPESSVAALCVRDAGGAHADAAAAADGVSFAAFDIKDAGVVGFILPGGGETGSLRVQKACGEYVVTLTAAYTPGTGINKYDETGGCPLNSVTCGCRIYTDETHDFTGAERAAAIERSPLGVTAADGSPVTYEPFRGCYTVELSGTGFQYAYDNPETRFPVTLTAPGTDDRDIYIRAATGAGSLEACVVLDDTDTLVPIDVQVCKNFGGDIAEYYYSIKDYSYGEAYFPVEVKAGRDLTLTAVHLYQNWGNVPLKQLSSIEFGVSFFLLSTGTTESCCIAPYYANGKTGFLLPDFRSRSGIMWSGQPQFNSIGKPCFMLDRTCLTQTAAELQGSRIRSVGPTHADIEMRFLSADGSYRYTLRHVEFPQTDENRVYYTVDVEFLKDKTYLNFRGDVDLFFLTGYLVRFRSIAFQNENGEEETVALDYGVTKKYHKLGGEYPYYTLLTVDRPEEESLNSTFGANAAALVRGYSVTCGGRPFAAPLTVREHAYSDFSDTGLTLDVRTIAFKKGDTIHMDLILLPWGTGIETTTENVRAVRADSCVDRLAVTAATGAAVDDPLVPTVRCTDDTAEFTVTGGRNNCAVKVSGFMRFGRLAVERLEDGEWRRLTLNGPSGYDGYGVKYEPDGTYSYSFVFAADGAEETFRVTVE